MRFEQIDFNPKYWGNLSRTNEGQAWPVYYFVYRKLAIVVSFVDLRRAWPGHILLTPLNILFLS